MSAFLLHAVCQTNKPDIYSTVENAQDLFVGSVYTATSELKPEHASSYSQKEITQNLE